MNLEEIKNLDLSVADFDLLIKGLDQLPNSPFGNLGSMVINMSEITSAAAIERKIKGEFEKKAKERDALKEDTTLLKAKLITLKRFMAANDLLKQAKDIIG